MAFEEFRTRQAHLLRGFSFTDEDVRKAVRAIKARNLPPTDKLVVAQLKLNMLGKHMRKSD